jgi:4-amino-4-deoxy-L-arabinose transferase-like glycosyltransferase
MVYRMLLARGGQFSSAAALKIGKNRVNPTVLATLMHFPARGMTTSAYILSVLGLVRKNAGFFLAGSLAALALRLFFVFRFPAVVDDSRLYADIAENWLQHGIYGITNSGRIMPTLSRLPGYPAFLAAIFSIFGANNFRAVLLIQVLFDLGTCFVVSDIARRMLSERAAKAAFLLAALCPFLANYAAAALTETLEIFFTALAFDHAICGIARFRDSASDAESGSLIWLASGLSIGACILSRPDGGILLGAIAVYLFLVLLRRILRKKQTDNSSACSKPIAPVLFAGVIVAIGALAPLIPWTLRNLYTFHRFQPLAPRYANDADEPPTPGFNRWIKTWMADYTSVEEIYWNVPGDNINLAQLPGRAFDSPEQRNETAQLFAAYNQNHDLTPELDACFATLAAQRIRAAPLRYYVWLPILRIADMWLRPRTELLPSDPRWWEFNDQPVWLTVSLVFGLVNLFYVGAATLGFLRSRHVFGMGLLFLFFSLRSLFLGTLENPEPRYTLECYPVVMVLAAALFIHETNRNHRKPA